MLTIIKSALTLYWFFAMIFLSDILWYCHFLNKRDNWFDNYVYSLLDKAFKPLEDYKE